MKDLFLTWCAIKLNYFLGGNCDQGYSKSEEACLKEFHVLPWEHQLSLLLNFIWQNSLVLLWVWNGATWLSDLGAIATLHWKFQNDYCQKKIFIFSKCRICLLTCPVSVFPEIVSPMRVRSKSQSQSHGWRESRGLRIGNFSLIIRPGNSTPKKPWFYVIQWLSPSPFTAIEACQNNRGNTQSWTVMEHTLGWEGFP